MKKGITPSKNINKLFEDLDIVSVRMFTLSLYFKYLIKVIQANITLNPIKTPLYSKISKFTKITSSSNATKEPNSCRKCPATLITNQKSKNYILSNMSKSYQFFLQSTFPFMFYYFISCWLSEYIFFLKIMYSFEI